MAESASRLLDAVRRLNQSLDPSQVSLLVCEEAARLLGADTASVFVGSPSDGMRTEATYGRPAERIGEPVEVGHGLVGEVIQRDEPMLADGDAAVPLHWDGGLRGVLAVGFERAEPVSADELELLEAFGELAAAACRNASAHAGLALAARTDALTGCLNHSAMHDALGREVERCRRKGHELSLVILDLDEFKQVNEQHGHLAGDEVLRQVGESLRESVRAYDLVARYGGDEFAVIAMDADEATATEVARRAVEAVDRTLGALGSAGEATAATAGVAEWQTGDTPSGLIGRADRALLHGKHSGLRGTAVKASSLPGPRRTAAARATAAQAAAAQAAADSESSSARQSRSTPASGRPKTSTSTARAPRSSSGLVASATAARGPPSRSSMLKIVPPSSMASRAEGGNSGRPPSRSRRMMAGRR